MEVAILTGATPSNTIKNSYNLKDDHFCSSDTLIMDNKSSKRMRTSSNDFLEQQQQLHGESPQNDNEDALRRKQKHQQHDHHHEQQQKQIRLQLQRRDDFIRTASKLRHAMGTVLRRVVDAALAVSQHQRQNQNQRNGDNLDVDKSHSSPKEAKSLGGDASEDANMSYTAELAREKATECLILKKELKEAEIRMAALDAANNSLRDASSRSSDKLERTTEALKIASVNASAARADADAAEARARALAKQMSSLRKVVEEMKHACDMVHQEHDEISNAARHLESSLLRTDTQLSRTLRDRDRLHDECLQLRDDHDRLDRQRSIHETELDKLRNELDRAKRMAEEREALELSRAEQAQEVGRELADAKKVLVRMTDATVEQESLTASLQGTVEDLRAENKKLHDKVEELCHAKRRAMEEWNEQLGKVEMDHQRLQMKESIYEEEKNKLKLDCAAAERQVSQMKAKIASLERVKYAAVTEAVGLSPPTSALQSHRGVDRSYSGTKTSTKTDRLRERTSVERSVEGRGSESSLNKESIFSPSYSSQRDADQPPLRDRTLARPNSVNKSQFQETLQSLEQSSGSSASRTYTAKNQETNTSSAAIPRRGSTSFFSSSSMHDSCALCTRRPFGMMKACQCKAACGKKAHASCLANRNKTLTDPSIARNVFCNGE